MATSLLTHWVSDHEIKAICWTLIHSLWIGLVIAALAGAVIAATQKSSPNFRYSLLCGILVLFVLAIGVTFFIELGWGSQSQITAYQTTAFSAGSPAATNVNNVQATGISLVNRSVAFLNQQSGWIFFIWLICFAAKSIKMVGGLLYVRRIRLYKTHRVSEEWNNKIASFRQKIGIRKPIQLLQSELIKVPVTIGFLKPVILLPFGLILQLPADQVETILWHEFAHIMRRDYLVNILQSIVEIVFFFNPGLLWLSTLIRDEREACCDDLVLANVPKKGNYLNALLSFQSYNDTSAGYAMALGSGGDQLRNRLKRMINQENKRLSMTEKIVLVSGLVVICFFTAVPKAKSEIKHGVIYLKNSVIAMVSGKHDSAPVAKLQANNTKTHQPIVKVADSFKDSTSIKRDSLLTIAVARINSNYSVGQRDSLLKITIGKVNSGITKKQRDSLLKLAVANVNRGITKKQRDSLLKLAVANVNRGITKKQRDSLLKIALVNAKPIKTKKQLDSLLKMDGPVKKRIDSVTNGIKERMRSVMIDLINENVIKDKNSLNSFQLTNSELIVNGVKQPENIQEKLKQRHIKGQSGLFYGPLPSQMHSINGYFYDGKL